MLFHVHACTRESCQNTFVMQTERLSESMSSQKSPKSFETSRPASRDSILDKGVKKASFLDHGLEELGEPVRVKL